MKECGIDSNGAESVNDIAIIQTNINCNQIIDLIESVAFSQYPFKQVDNRPHLTSYIPLDEDLLEHEYTTVLKAQIKSLVYPHVSKYIEKHGLESLESRPNILASKLLAGNEMPAHIECDEDNRTFFFDLYLNENYEGGSLYFDDLNLIIKPKTGMLIISPGKYRHGVTKLISGVRYSIGSGFFE